MAKRDADIWMPLDIGKYLGDTMHLTTLQHGAYLLLLMDYWKRGPLQNDERRLAAISKMDASSNAWVDAWAVLRDYFPASDDGLLHNAKADKEISKANANHSSASTKASNAAKARWSSDAPSIASSNASSTPQAMPRDASSPSPSPSPKEGTPPSPLKEGEQNKKSLLVYNCYPRKIGRNAAIRAIEKAARRLIAGECGSPTANYDEAITYLCQRATLFARAPAGNNGEYTPHPATWFNDSRYLDDESEWSKGNSNGQNQRNGNASLGKQADRNEANRDAILAGIFGANAGGNAAPGGGTGEDDAHPGGIGYVGKAGTKLLT